MPSTIIVPLDGSPFAEKALGPAAWLAQAFDAPLRLVTTTFTEDTAELQGYLDGAAAATGVTGAIGIVLRPHFPGSGIADYAVDTADAALCMTTHGRSGLGDLLLGGVADEIVRATAAPIVLVGGACADGAPRGNALMVCHDGSPRSAAMLPVAAAWAGPLGLELHLVTVADEDGDWGAEGAGAALAAEAGALTVEGRAPTVTVLPHARDLADALGAHAIEISAGLVAMSTHGSGGMITTALGKVVTHVVRHSPVPVLVQRPAS